MPNLHEYFLEQIPQQKGFNSKSSLANNDRYKRMCAVLKSKEPEVFMSFMIYLARDFSRFMVPLQASAPMIHRLYPMCLQLIRNTMGKVVLDEHMFKKGQAVLFSK